MDMVAGVRAHAEAHYEEGGWDFLVECWEDDRILEVIEGAATVAEAIDRCADILGVLDERRAEVRAEIF